MMKRTLMLGASLFFMIVGVQAQNLADAQKAIEEEQFTRAKGILEGLVQKQPKKGENYFYLGQIHLHNEHLDSARMIFEQGNAAQPKNLINQAGLGIVDLFMGNVSQAETRFTQVTNNIGRRNYLELYFIGRAYVDAPDPDYGKATQYLRQALDRSGRRVDPLIHLAMGDAYFGAGESNQAYLSYRNAILINPNLTKAEVQMAVIIRNSRAWTEAITALEDITQQKPNYAPTYRELAETYNRWAVVASTDTVTYRERNRMAVDYYKQYMDLTDYSVESRIRYADFLVYAGDYDELQVQAQELSELEDVNPKILRYLGHSSYHKGELARASDALERFFASGIEDERVIARDHLYYGLALVKLATAGTETDFPSFEKGIAEIKAAVELDPVSANNLNVVGRELFATAKNYEEAAKVFEISANTEGSSNQVTDTYYFGLSSYFYLANRLNSGIAADREWVDKAENAFAYVIEKAPNLVEPYLYRARNQQLLEDRENPTGIATPYYMAYIDAVKSQEPAEQVKARANLIEIYNNLAYLHVQKEEYDEARKMVEETIKLDADNQYAKQILDFLDQVRALDAR